MTGAHVAGLLARAASKARSARHWVEWGVRMQGTMSEVSDLVFAESSRRARVRRKCLLLRQRGGNRGEDSKAVRQAMQDKGIQRFRDSERHGKIARQCGNQLTERMEDIT